MSRATRQALFSVLAVVVLLALWWLVRDNSAGTSQTSGTSGGGTSQSAPAGTRTAAPIPSNASSPDSGLDRIKASDLPRAAQQVIVLIHQGGPFRYRQDGGTFGNNEGLLPDQRRGYYQEYTVKEGTAGDRGPLRIVGGAAGDLYWTSDHYASFRQIEEGS